MFLQKTFPNGLSFPSKRSQQMPKYLLFNKLQPIQTPDNPQRPQNKAIFKNKG